MKTASELFISLENAAIKFDKKETDILELAASGRLCAHFLPLKAGRLFIIMDDASPNSSGYWNEKPPPHVIETSHIKSLILSSSQCLEILLTNEVTVTEFQAAMFDSEPYSSNQNLYAMLKKENTPFHIPFFPSCSFAFSSSEKLRDKNFTYKIKRDDIDPFTITKRKILFLINEVTKVLAPNRRSLEKGLDRDFVRRKAPDLFSLIELSEELWSRRVAQTFQYPTRDEIAHALSKEMDGLSKNDLVQYMGIMTPEFATKMRKNKEVLEAPENPFSTKLLMIVNICENFHKEARDRQWIATEARRLGLSVNHAKAAQKLIAPTVQKEMSRTMLSKRSK